MLNRFTDLIMTRRDEFLIYYHPNSNEMLPNEIDWRKLGAVTPVGNQGRNPKIKLRIFLLENTCKMQECVPVAGLLRRSVQSKGNGSEKPKIWCNFQFNI